MSSKIYIVKLRKQERQQLEALIRKGKSGAARLLKARVLLKADCGPRGEAWPDERIIEALDTNASMVYRVRRGFAEKGLEAVLTRKKRSTPPVQPLFDGEKEAHLIRLACSEPPAGRSRWTLRLLADKLVELDIMDAVNFNTVGRGVKKNQLQPHLNRQWVIPPKANAAFVAAMEDVLDVYKRPRDPDRPLVCLDEASRQLTRDTRTALPMKPGRVKRIDHEYQRNGTANLFMFFAPLEGWRRVKVTDRRTAIDYAHALRELADVQFPKAAKIVLVQDNLNTHKPASLYEAFPPAKARRLVERFEWHYTPKHGSWLNMAETELAVLSRQCLDRRIPDKSTLDSEARAWQKYRNIHNAKADWHFTTQDARVKLKRLYPVI
ncbi:MAG: IS630 family transposase [Verrucomicrobiales bacterium]|nr:IS630 family transposase [Verrucomicrobiales bacterium]